MKDNQQQGVIEGILNIKQKKHRHGWFERRVGKVVYRYSKKGGIGFKIIDTNHARYLFLSQNELNLFYYD